MAHSVWDGTKHAAASLTDGTKSAATMVAEGTKNTATTVVEGTKHAASSVADGTKNAANTVVGGTKHIAAAGAEKTGQAWEGIVQSKRSINSLLTLEHEKFRILRNIRIYKFTHFPRSSILFEAVDLSLAPHY